MGGSRTSGTTGTPGWPTQPCLSTGRDGLTPGKQTTDVCTGVTESTRVCPSVVSTRRCVFYSIAPSVHAETPTVSS